MMMPILVVAFFACAQQPQIVYRTEQVKVPVPVRIYCDVPAQTDPELPIARLTAASSDADVARAYAESIEILKSEVDARADLLAACRQPEGAR